MSKLTWIDLNERAFERLVNNFMFVFSTSNVGNVTCSYSVLRNMYHTKKERNMYSFAYRPLDLSKVDCVIA